MTSESTTSERPPSFLPEISAGSRLSFEPASPPGLSTTPDEPPYLSSSSSITSPASSVDSHSSRVLLPIPTPSLNGSQASFTFSDVDLDGNPLEPLPPEIATADLSIAPDGSFVETSSGPAARELKLRYDAHYGVGPNVRSPYTITAFVNQHGRSMYRVGNREKKTPPAASTAEAVERVSQSVASSQSSRAHSPRRSRVSVGLFAAKPSSSSSRPTTSSGHRKLRKTRSFSEMATTTNAPSSRPTGRGHSQSVTAADFVPPATSETTPSQIGDIFGDIMGWHPSRKHTSSSLSSEASASASISGRSGNNIPHPFGQSILFESPSRKPRLEFLPTPRLLREMQSFESGLTAKQGDSDSVRRLASFDTASLNGSDGTRPPSAFRVRDSTASFMSEATTTNSESVEEPEQEPEPAQEAYGPAPETAMYSRYSTDVFDVLQTYRGLPLLEKLAPGEETTVIKLSLSADNTAAPRDDPRFVIWGELVPERERDNDEHSQTDHTDGGGSSSALSSNLSKKRSVKSNAKAKSTDVPVLKLSPEDGLAKVLVAASIERWIAQLTSDLNYEELLNFFLTYRTYINGVDLCHLLICRFHWALQQPSNTQEETVRRVVRVRTFVAIRYWLLTFFSVDFLPDRELRLLMANWLNTLSRDPILKRHVDGLSIVRKLKKVAKECRQIHTRSSKSQASRPTSVKAPTTQQTEVESKASHVLGERFAAATRKAADDEDSDVDLDFAADQDASERTAFNSDLANAHLSTVHLGGGAAARTSAMPLSSISILQRTDHLGDPNPVSPFVQSAATLPVHHNALSRVLVKTIGRLGRWRRVLNQRGGARGHDAQLGVCVDVDAVDLEVSVHGDLLTVNGGVEQYLKMIEPPPTMTMKAPSTEPQPESQSTEEAETEVVETTSIPTEAPPDYAESIAPSVLSADSEAVNDTSSVISPEPNSLPESLRPESFMSDLRPESIDTRRSFRSTSTDSFGAPISSGAALFPNGAQSQWQFEVMSIDQLDLSDNSSDEHGEGDGPALPPGLRQPVRRLPLRRDFEFVQRPDSVSSMGIQSAGHLSHVSGASDAPINGGAISQWQMNALVDSLSDNGDAGDVEAALKALEGQIDKGKVQEKASKVNTWMKTMRERFLTGDYDDTEEPRYSDDDEDEEEVGVSSSISNDEGFTTDDDTNNTTELITDDDSVPLEEHAADTPIYTTRTAPMSPPRPADEAKPAPEDAVPLEILQSRMPLVPQRAPPISKFVVSEGSAATTTPNTSRFHHSFVIGFPSQVIAGHFAMIDRELFMGVKFEEVLEDWSTVDEEPVLDWAQFLRERARLKADPQWAEKISALAAVRARFNLMANWVASEIVLSAPQDRTAVFTKFIRIAWQSYMMNSFNTLVAIVAALLSPVVGQAVRWKSIPKWEGRVFRDLKAYCTSHDDFKHIRAAIADTKSQDVNSSVSEDSRRKSATVDAGTNNPNKPKPKSPACIPFIGVYLSQLHRHSRLPDLIDPTAPTEAVGIDTVTSNFDAPAHPEVFAALAPLPPSIHLEPLINVHKQRLIAGVVKTMVGGQHLASRFEYEGVEKRLYQRCLRLRGLSAAEMARALKMYPA
ncbi:hypothetical protein MIND_00959800 [Mycena indigotica]|uniref:Ras GEF n=1 Tax=Mycena indigotica TaxID=2126181 RepID=A0A8H6SEI6_9AGAR|nr:uncharacterized protein MIND_00959800 [Mycena indigotica]KAF7297266.1 hypothetical protein MIND_00959800 [Mycena indigotica]